MAIAKVFINMHAAACLQGLPGLCATPQPETRYFHPAFIGNVAWLARLGLHYLPVATCC